MMFLAWEWTFGYLILPESEKDAAGWRCLEWVDVLHLMLASEKKVLRKFLKCSLYEARTNIYCKTSFGSFTQQSRYILLYQFSKYIQQLSQALAKTTAIKKPETKLRTNRKKSCLHGSGRPGSRPGEKENLKRTSTDWTGHTVLPNDLKWDQVDSCISNRLCRFPLLKTNCSRPKWSSTKGAS